MTALAAVVGAQHAVSDSGWSTVISTSVMSATLLRRVSLRLLRVRDEEELVESTELRAELLVDLEHVSSSSSAADPRRETGGVMVMIGNTGWA